MDNHLHTGVDTILFVTLAAIVGFHVIRFGAGMAAKQDGWLGEVGKAAGSLVTFGGTN